MTSDLPKVLLPLCGRPIIAYILDLLSEVDISHPVVVTGWGGDILRSTLGSSYIYADQAEQLGSGHAVVCAREAAQGSKNVLVMCGDSPLFRADTVRSLISTHLQLESTVTLVSAVLTDPTGYGRILRGPDGSVTGIVEEKLASVEQRMIREVNGGCYAFSSEWLWKNIGSMQKNEVGEYCLTEMVDIAISQCRVVCTVTCMPDEIAGINTPEQLRAAEEILAARGHCGSQP
jgi:bifunctional UDP-N-acetylglucosamine pyrophosphorylase/glucosamine-1-phosphate N-acetyltransferase